MPLLIILVLLVVSSAAVYAQGNDSSRKQAHAVRMPNGSIDIDGRLDEAAWRNVPALIDFIQKEPVEGAPPSDRMEVRFAYDDIALYVGARMYSTAPIQSPMGRRDEGDQAEHLLISLDTYLDRRTASTFGVTASGVRLDRYYARDDDFGFDSGYNPVWRARTTVDAAGWNAELWIPFSQLRFTDRNPQVWGLNVQRWVPSRNEEVFWVLIPRIEDRWTSLFGDLHGITGVRPSRRLELLPYTAGASRVIGARDPADPFTGGANLEGRVGLDAKVGLGPNLTLEATVNPDFGQVEADPAEVNLSAFETFFDERRPFFVEGSQLLTGDLDNYFYSRRIGAAPSGRASGDFVDYPSASTILGAAKLTGRLASGTSLGVLGAVTAEESARTFTIGQPFGWVRVAPQTTYGVGRVQQEFGRSGSSIALMGTAVHRQLAEGDLLGALLTRNALSLSSESLMRLNDGEYELQLYSGLSYVGGEAGAIQRLQRSSARYFQRPDADYVTYDPNRTSMAGTKSGGRIERLTGRHWMWEANTTIETPGFETNDIGRLSTTDRILAGGQLEYRETVPGRWWRDYSMRLNNGNVWNLGGDRQRADLEASVNITWPNFWETELSGEFDPRVQEMRLTRGGPSMEEPRRWATSLDVESSNASQTRAEASLEYGRDEDGGLTLNVDGGLTFQPGSQWQLSVEPGYERELNTQQYVTTLGGGRAALFGSRYIFAHIERSTYSTEFRLNYTFKPDLTLDLYAEPFAASGRYDHFGELAAARTRLVRRYGGDGTTLQLLEEGSRLVTDGPTRFELANRDFNVQSFRSNLVLRWEWRAGSTLYLVWQQDRSSEQVTSARATAADMFSSLGTPGDNFFAIKASFWFSPR